MTDPARLLRVLVRMNVILGMRHQAEDIPLWIADPGNIKNGAIRVSRIFAICRGAIRTDIGKGNLILGIKSGTWEVFASLKVSLAMGDRTLD